MLITIDGPSGTGKSTVAKALANRLNVLYVDTGAMYRAVTWYFMDNQVDVRDIAKASRYLQQFSFNIKRTSNGDDFYYVNGQPVTDLIRMRDVTEYVSEVSASSCVRDALKPLHLELAKECDCVFEGRDLGTVLFPNADIKFFLTASLSVRAQRRYDQMDKNLHTTSLKEVMKDLCVRDQKDESRQIAPLKQPLDSIKIDSSEMSFQEVVDKMLVYIQEKKRCL